MSVAAFSQNRLRGFSALAGLPYPSNPNIIGVQTSPVSYHKTIGTDTASLTRLWNTLSESAQQQFLDYRNGKVLPGLPGYRARSMLALTVGGRIYNGSPNMAQGMGVIFQITDIKHPSDFGQIGPFFNKIDIAKEIKKNVNNPGFWHNISNPNFHKGLTLAILTFAAIATAGATAPAAASVASSAPSAITATPAELTSSFYGGSAGLSTSGAALPAIGGTAASVQAAQDAALVSAPTLATTVGPVAATTAAPTAATTAPTAATTATTGTTAATTAPVAAATLGPAATGGGAAAGGGLLATGSNLLKQGSEAYKQLAPILETAKPLPGNAPRSNVPVAPSNKLDLKSVAIPIGVALAALYAAST